MKIAGFYSHGQNLRVKGQNLRVKGQNLRGKIFERSKFATCI